MGFELTIPVLVRCRLIQVKNEFIILEGIKHLCLRIQDGAKVQYHFTEGQEPLNKHECKSFVRVLCLGLQNIHKLYEKANKQADAVRDCHYFKPAIIEGVVFHSVIDPLHQQEREARKHASRVEHRVTRGQDVGHL